MIRTVQEFAEACRNLSSEEVYELFEDNITPELRDEIYDTYSDVDCLEPTRQALNAIGANFAVGSLIEY